MNCDIITCKTFMNAHISYLWPNIFLFFHFCIPLLSLVQTLLRKLNTTEPPYIPFPTIHGLRLVLGEMITARRRRPMVASL